MRARIVGWLAGVLRSGRLPAFLIAVGAGVILYGFLMSPDYAIETIVVDGASLGDPARIAAQTSTSGVSVFWIDSDRVARRVARLPYVERVQTTVSFPPRLHIQVTERRPVLAWDTADGLLLIDERGHILARVDSAELPIVRGQGDGLAVGGRVSAKRVAAVLAVHDALGTRAESVIWTSVDGLTVEMPDDREVIFGDEQKFALKLAVYERLKQTVDPSWSVLDLREPDRPYFE